MPHVASIEIVDFNPLNEELTLEGDKKKISWLVYLVHWLQDWIDSDAKWVRTAEQIDTIARTSLENKQQVEPARYRQLIQIAEQSYAILRGRTTLLWPNSQLKESCTKLRRQLIALKYRAGITPSEPYPEEQLNSLKRLIHERLCSPDHFWCAPLQVAELNRGEFWWEQRWNEIAPKIAAIEGLTQLLIDDSDQREKFIRWALRDQAPVELFAGFTELVDQLQGDHQMARLGRASLHRPEGFLLKIERTANECYLTLPVEREPNQFIQVPLLSKERFMIGRGISSSLKELAQALYERFDDIVPPYQLTQQGLRLFHTHKLAIPSYDEAAGRVVYEAIPDSDVDSWWAALPPYELISLDQAQRRCHGLDGTNPALILHGTNSNDLPDPVGNHGYIEVLLPVANGSYQFYSFGRISRECPRGVLETALFAGNTVPATVYGSPDQNDEFSERQNWAVALALQPSSVAKLKEVIYLQVKETREGERPYSLLGDNCNRFANDVAKALLPQELVSEEELNAAQLQERIDELTMMHTRDQLRCKGFSSSFLNMILSGIRQRERPGNGETSQFLHHFFWLLGGWRRYEYEADGERKSSSICENSPLVTSERFFSPVKIGILAREHLKRKQEGEKLEDLLLYVPDNRVYIANGWDFLKKIRPFSLSPPIGNSSAGG